MGLLEETLQGQNIADYTNEQLRLSLNTVLYTNTADMWRRYLIQQGYSGAVGDMMAKWWVDNNVPAQFRNYINSSMYLLNSQTPVYPLAGDYLRTASNGAYLTDELGNRLTA